MIRLLELFIRFFQMGLFSIGGGYAIIPLIQEQVVHSFQWLSLREYTDIITISQMTPGPLVVNTASFVGVRLAGVWGATLATIGSVLAGFGISILLYHFFNKYQDIHSISFVLRGLRASSLGLIASAAGTIILIAFFGGTGIDLPNLNLMAIGVFVVALLALRKWKPNPIWIILLSGVAGIFIYA